MSLGFGNIGQPVVRLGSENRTLAAWLDLVGHWHSGSGRQIAVNKYKLGRPSAHFEFELKPCPISTSCLLMLLADIDKMKMKLAFTALFSCPRTNQT